MTLRENLNIIRSITESIIDKDLHIIDLYYRNVDMGVFGKKGYYE